MSESQADSRAGSCDNGMAGSLAGGRVVTNLHPAKGSHQQTFAKVALGASRLLGRFVQSRGIPTTLFPCENAYARSFPSHGPVAGLFAAYVRRRCDCRG